MLKFNKWEWEIIKHRLEVPEALYESLFEDSQEVTESEVYNICFHKLLPTNGNIGFKLSDVEMEILKGCMKSSTFLADSDIMSRYPEDYGMTKSQVYSLFKAADRLEERFNVTIPRS